MDLFTKHFLLHLIYTVLVIGVLAVFFYVLSLDINSLDEEEKKLE